MQHNPLQLEILLPDNTTFAQRQKRKANTAISTQHLSPIEQLEQACCQGLLEILFKEIIQRIIVSKRLYLWHIDQCADVLQIQLSEFPVYIQEKCSIDPHFFLPVLVYN
ncbi:hypothetical protein OCK74_03610 [Chitinophagaceae bacterium LB-8]|uniref:Uncharacterized protein n=1 Tax=Paraflavisolibacter caeni TaxID=2982496 RepID=A0A9X3BGQ6_9BACT|nr:hypothetical protein [Paraflavisolibacter caeni]MCU7548182.1 hypothetical protein [Paraflavisolibacter caeni]